MIGATPSANGGAFGQLFLPIDFITQSSAILAMKRVGKSNAAVVIAEEVYRNDLPFIAVDPKGDWYGLRADGPTLKGLDVVIIGGPHGDIPVQPTKAAGAAIANFVVRDRPSVIIDVSDMSTSEQAAFLQAFFDTLYKTNSEPLLLILEEADQVVPERSNMLPEQTRLVHSVVRLVKQGGFKGIGTLVITQRAATLNKSVLSQIENLIVMRTASPGDKKVVGEWLDNAVGGKELVSALPALQQGEAYIVSPFFMPSKHLSPLTHVQFNQRGTADTGQTPKIGEARKAVRLRDVDLEGLTRVMGEEIEKAQADDPAYLRREIKRLQTELRGVQENAKETIVKVDVPTPFIPEDWSTWLRAHAEFLMDAHHDIQQMMSKYAAVPGGGPLLVTFTKHDAEPPPPPPSHASTQKAVARPADPDGLPTRLKAGARRIVQVLLAMNRTMTKSELSVLANVATTGGTWSTYIGQVKAAGLVGEQNGLYYATDKARVEYPGVEPLDIANIEAVWRQKMKAGAKRMFDILKAEYPRALDKEELSARAEVSTSGGTWSTYVGQVVRTGLVERLSTGELRAADILFQ